jgi:hypothetical protein
MFLSDGTEIATITSIGARFIAGTGTTATGPTTATGITTRAFGYVNASGYRTKINVSILTQTVVWNWRAFSSAMVSGSPLPSVISASDTRPLLHSLTAPDQYFLLGLGRLVAQPFLVRLTFRGFAAEGFCRDFGTFAPSSCQLFRIALTSFEPLGRMPRPGVLNPE